MNVILGSWYRRRFRLPQSPWATLENVPNSHERLFQYVYLGAERFENTGSGLLLYWLLSHSLCCPCLTPSPPQHISRFISLHLVFPNLAFACQCLAQLCLASHRHALRFCGIPNKSLNERFAKFREFANKFRRAAQHRHPIMMFLRRAADRAQLCRHTRGSYWGNLPNSVWSRRLCHVRSEQHEGRLTIWLMLRDDASLALRVPYTSEISTTCITVGNLLCYPFFSSWISDGGRCTFLNTDKSCVSRGVNMVIEVI